MLATLITFCVLYSLVCAIFFKRIMKGSVSRPLQNSVGNCILQTDYCKWIIDIIMLTDG